MSIQEQPAAIATILRQSDNEICFAVDNVEICQERLPVESARDAMARELDKQLYVSSHDDQFEIVAVNKYEQGLNPLVHAVHLAFSEHRPLLLTPDIIWMTISQGFAQHINNNAEIFRERFVRHQGKLELTVKGTSISEREDWINAIDKWIEGIFTHVDPTLHRILSCEFSTTTPTIRTASQVVIMDAFQKYFDFRFYCICGIPQITLQGDLDDWREIRTRVEMIAEYELDWWTSRLLPICDGFISTIKGEPPLEFWQEIYKPQKIYGGEVITGWLADLFPYIKNPFNGNPDWKNPMMETSRAELVVDDGIRPKNLPRGLSQAPVTIESKYNEMRVELLAGFIGIKQHAESGELKPEIGWLVSESDQYGQFLKSLKEQHNAAPPVNFLQLPNIVSEMPKELVQLHDTFDGINLFAGTTHPWHLRSLRDYTKRSLIGFNNEFIHFIDLKDGRAIAYDFLGRYLGSDDDPDQQWHEELWIVVGKPMTYQTNYGERDGFIKESVVVIAKGIPQLFERMMQADGEYYFDRADFVPDDHLDNMKK